MAPRQRQARSDEPRYVQQEPEMAVIPAPRAPLRGGAQDVIGGELAALGRDGFLGRLLAGTLEQLLETERGALAAERSAVAEGRTSPAGKVDRGSQSTRVTSPATNTRISEEVARVIEPKTLTASDLDERVIALYAKGLSTKEIQETLREGYGVELTPAAISAITDKVWTLVEAWQSRPLANVYPIVFLDAIHLKLRRDGKVITTAVYIVLGVDLEGQRDVLGHWVGDGAESANFWLSVVTDLQSRGVQDIFIACVDGLPGFKTAIQAVFPKTHIQRCLVHQVRHSLAYVSWKDRKAVAEELKTIYCAPTREAAEGRLTRFADRWGKTYPIAVRSWEQNWPDLAMMFEYAPDIRRLIYTTNHVESYNGALRKVVKIKGAFPSAEAVRKLLFLANRTITERWTKTIANWPSILNQLAIRFEDRVWV